MSEKRSRFKSMLAGALRSINDPANRETCEVCAGEGLLQRMDGKSVVTCPECDGDGYTLKSIPLASCGGVLGGANKDAAMISKTENKEHYTPE